MFKAGVGTANLSHCSLDIQKRHFLDRAIYVLKNTAVCPFDNGLEDYIEKKKKKKSVSVASALIYFGWYHSTAALRKQDIMKVQPSQHHTHFKMNVFQIDAVISEGSL